MTDDDFDLVLDPPSAPAVSYPDCVHELPINQCGYCSKAIRPMTEGPVFRAQYDGRCGDCGHHFDAGDPIRADGQGSYIHEECP